MCVAENARECQGIIISPITSGSARNLCNVSTVSQTPLQIWAGSEPKWCFLQDEAGRACQDAEIKSKLKWVPWGCSHLGLRALLKESLSIVPARTFITERPQVSEIIWGKSWSWSFSTKGGAFQDISTPFRVVRCLPVQRTVSQPAGPGERLLHSKAKILAAAGGWAVLREDLNQKPQKVLTNSYLSMGVWIIPLQFRCKQGILSNIFSLYWLPQALHSPRQQRKTWKKTLTPQKWCWESRR